MRESTTDLLIDLPDTYNTTQLLVDRLASGGGAPIYSVRRGGAWIDITTARFVDTVRGVAKSLVAAGLRPGDPVAIMSRTRYEWTVAEQAVWFAGGFSVAIYETSSPFQVEWILRDSGARHVFTEDASHARVVEQAAAELGDPVTVWTFENDGAGPAASTIPAPGLAALAEAGHAGAVTDAQVEEARRSRRLSDLATLVYTSGTTGRPKGCRITHANFSLVSVNLAKHMHQVVPEGSRNLMFLPLAHVLARAVQQVLVHSGTTVGHSSGAADLMDDLAAFKPTFLLAVPRVFEKLRAGALAKAEAGGKRDLFLSAEQAAIEVSRVRDAKARGLKARLSPLTAARHLLFDKVLYPKLRAVLGGNVEYTVSGASVLNPDLAHFFSGAGLTLLEGYGLTETTAPATVNMPGRTRIGTVGVPIPGTTIRIADDGEVLVKGIGVFDGYHNNPQASAECFVDGFFRTGDLGSLDEDGFLTITGRSKDLLVTAGGKNVSPGPLEEIVRASRLVSQVVVVGEKRPFVAAIITLDAGELAPWAKAKGLGTPTLAEAAKHPEVLAEVQAAIDRANATVSHAEAIKKFLVLDHDFTEETGHLTPSLKLKRSMVMETCAAEIDSLYTD